MNDAKKEKIDLTVTLLGKEVQVEFLSVRQVIMIHDELIERIGGLAGIRDHKLLESAINKPMNSAAYSKSLPDLTELAASLTYGLSQNHPFADGNIRTAFASAQTFFELNNLEFAPDPAEALKIFRGIASGMVKEEGLSAWYKHVIRTSESPGLNSRLNPS